MREEFEAWAKSPDGMTAGEDGGFPPSFAPLEFSPHLYKDDDVDFAWRVWQAATKATIQRIQSATVAQSTLPGALTLSGDFFKVK